MFYQFCEQDWWYDYSRYSPECTYTKALLYNSMEGELFLAPGQQQPAARSRLAQIYQHWQFDIRHLSQKSSTVQTYKNKLLKSKLLSWDHLIVWYVFGSEDKCLGLWFNYEKRRKKMQQDQLLRMHWNGHKFQNQVRERVAFQNIRLRLKRKQMTNKVYMSTRHHY